MNNGPVPPPPPPPGGQSQQAQKTCKAQAALSVGKLQPGDILIEGADMGGQHALMWVGGTKPVTHSASDHYFGVMQQSTGYFDKKGFSPDEYRMGTAVFRCGDLELSQKAAEFAGLWATPSDAVALPRNRTEYKGIVMRTPYSKVRQGASFERAAKWQATDPSYDRKGDEAPGPSRQTVEALFRVLKAIARAENRQSLSPNHGVACAQFVVYCYQAASLKLLLPGGRIPDNLLAAIKEKSPRARPNGDARFANWKKANVEDAQANFWGEKTWWAEQGVFMTAKGMAEDQRATSLLGMTLRHNGGSDLFTPYMPKAMNIDVRAYNIVQLQKMLVSSQSAFNWIGSLYKLPEADPDNRLDGGYRWIRSAQPKWR